MQTKRERLGATPEHLRRLTYGESVPSDQHQYLLVARGQRIEGGCQIASIVGKAVQLSAAWVHAQHIAEVR